LRQQKTAEDEGCVFGKRKPYPAEYQQNKKSRVRKVFNEYIEIMHCSNHYEPVEKVYQVSYEAAMIKTDSGGIVLG